MSSWRFLHAADLHLDSPLRGLEAEGAPVEIIRDASRAALAGLVDCALAEKVALVLLAGDLFDGAWLEARTGLHFAAQMKRLREAGIEVIAVRGNHDAQNRMSRQIELNIAVLSDRRPESRALEALGAVVHGQSYGAATPDGSGIDLARWPRALPGLLNIGLLHTCLEQSGLHERYAPTTRATLEGLGYDYWALGHIHAREEVSRDPWIVFPGNLQGRDVGETGPKGVTLGSVVAGRIVAVEARALDRFRWEQVAVDLDGAESEAAAQGVLHRALETAWEEAERRPIGVRLRLGGRTALHGRLTASGWRERATETAGQISELIWIEGVVPATAPRAAPLEGREDALGALARRIGELAATPGAVPFGEWVGQMREKLPELPPDHALHDPARLMEQARDLLLARLAAGGEES